MYCVVGFVISCFLCSWSASDPVPLNSSRMFSDATDVPVSSFSNDEKVVDNGSTDTPAAANPEHISSSAHLIDPTSEIPTPKNSDSQQELVSSHLSLVMGTTDLTIFRELFSASCKWQDTSGLEKQLRVCSNGSCDLGPMTLTRNTGSVQLYFCSDEQDLLVSMACRLEDKKRVLVLPKCMAGSECSIGPLNLHYEGKELQGYFCDSHMLLTSTEWSDETDEALRTQKYHDRSGLPWHNRGRAPVGTDDPTNRRQGTEENTSYGVSEMTSSKPELS